MKVTTVGALILLLCGAALSTWFAFTGKPPDVDEFGKPIDHTAYWVGIAAICTLALGFLLALLAVILANHNFKKKIAEAVQNEKDAFEDIRKAYGVTTRDLGEQISKLTKDLSKTKKGGFKSSFSSSSGPSGSPSGSPAGSPSGSPSGSPPISSPASSATLASPLASANLASPT